MLFETRIFAYFNGEIEIHLRYDPFLYKSSAFPRLVSVFTAQVCKCKWL